VARFVRVAAVGVVGVVVASAVWAASAVVAPPVRAEELAPSTYRYDPGGLEAELAISLSGDGMSVGFADDPVMPELARGASVEGDGPGRGGRCGRWSLRLWWLLRTARRAS
jgi:hypothetical protein